MNNLKTAELARSDASGSTRWTREENLLEERRSRRAFKRLFLEAYGKQDPILQLREIVHWAAVKTSFDVEELEIDHLPTFVFGGYFYNTSTPSPDHRELSEALVEGRALGAAQYLIPTLRSELEQSLLREFDFFPVPWFVESIFELERGDLDETLSDRIGAKALRALLRVVCRAREQYEFSWHDAATLQLNPSLLRESSSLLQMSGSKYCHSIDLYSERTLSELVRSPLGTNLLIGLRRDKHSRKAVQTVICLLDRARSHFHALMCGRDYSVSSTGQNLYDSMYYEMYQLCESLGVQSVYLGRGNPALKRRLGCNRTRILWNWLKSEHPNARDELEHLRAAAEKNLQINLLAR